jgi:hypothetical protein
MTLLLAALDELLPVEFFATTVNVYETFCEYEALTVIGLAVPEPVKPPGELVTIKLSALAPWLARVKATLTLVELVIVAVPIVGAIG